MSRFDVAIAGAGPAGAWAARALALGGARVALIDPSHPREKPCGGGLTARAVEFLERAGIRDLVPGVATTTLRFSSGGLSTTARAVMPQGTQGAAPLGGVSRRDLDGALVQTAQAAGAACVPERVTDIDIRDNGVTVRTRRRCLEAGFLLGADGANSLVRRRVQAPFSRSQLSIATGFYAHDVRSQEVAVHAVAAPPGYIWSFPRPDHAAIGICAQGDVAAASGLQRLVRDWTAHYLHDRKGVRLEAYSWPIPSLSLADFRREQPAGPRWMLLGDAAGLVDPLTREGIYFALLSGELAAQCLSAAGDPSSSYCNRLRTAIYPELARAAAMKAGFFTSHFTDLLVEALRRSGKVRAIMEDLVAGRQPYATLRRRLLGTFEVGLAWRLLMLQLRGISSFSCFPHFP